MKKIYLIALLFVLACYSSCYKKPQVFSKPRFNLSGLKDYYVNENEVTYIAAPFYFFDSGNTGEAVEIKIASTTGAITMEPETTSVQGEDSGQLHFRVNLSDAGTYPVKLALRGAHTTTKNVSFNVITQSACDQSIRGTWNAYDSGATTFVPSHYSAYVSTTGNTNELYFELYNRSPKGHLICHDGTIKLDGTSGITSTTAGTGAFSSRRIVLNYEITGGVNNIPVTTILTR